MEEKSSSASVQIKSKKSHAQKGGKGLFTNPSGRKKKENKKDHIVCSTYCGMNHYLTTYLKNEIERRKKSKKQWKKIGSSSQGSFKGKEKGINPYLNLNLNFNFNFNFKAVMHNPYVDVPIHQF